jgi:hypothetical protein
MQTGSAQDTRVPDRTCSLSMLLTLLLVRDKGSKFRDAIQTLLPHLDASARAKDIQALD